MTLAAESSVESSISDDFVAFLDAELVDTSSDSSSEQEVESKLNLQRMKRCKVEEPCDLYTKASMKTDNCAHDTFSYGGMCVDCGKSVEENWGVTLGHIHSGLKVVKPEMDRLRDSNCKNLFRNKKLYLILDLDHTLLNSTELSKLSSEEEYLRSQSNSLQDVHPNNGGGYVFKGSLYVLDKDKNLMPMMTKLRPFVHTFLKEANTMFDMYIYTAGDHSYASKMSKLLDPKQQYFKSKVISRDESTNKRLKDLDVVPVPERAVLILDDKEDVWPSKKDNLIVMERYLYFASSCRTEFHFTRKSLSEMRCDESAPDAVLAAILKVLRKIYDAFFYEPGDYPANRDVRLVMKTIRKEVLHGCKIVFSIGNQKQKDDFWKMAEQFGATCLTKLDASITHVISTNIHSEKSRWALNKKKFLINPRWLETTIYFWKRQAEGNFLLCRD